MVVDASKACHVASVRRRVESGLGAHNALPPRRPSPSRQTRSHHKLRAQPCRSLRRRRPFVLLVSRSRSQLTALADITQFTSFKSQGTSCGAGNPRVGNLCSITSLFHSHLRIFSRHSRVPSNTFHSAHQPALVVRPPSGSAQGAAQAPHSVCSCIHTPHLTHPVQSIDRPEHTPPLPTVG